MRRAWLLASLAPRIERLSDSVNARAPDLLELDDVALCAAAGVSDPPLAIREAGSAAEREGARLGRHGLAAICRHDSLYPSALRDLEPGAPATLFGRGDLELLAGATPERFVAIVGARRCTSYGREAAHELALLLAGAGMVIVSGLAYGIDAAAHRGALDAGGRTVAVLGSGAEVVYPAGHRELHRRVWETGLVLSEMPPGFHPFRWSFPARNRIMAALAGITIVVEAAERSGSLITARLARELGRDVGAVPGPINSRVSAGANSLLADGAAVIRDPQDVLDALLGAGVASAPARTGPALDSDLARVLALVEDGLGTPDTIASAVGLPPQVVATALTRLELAGYLAAGAAGAYSRTPLATPEAA
jgi:DNA processing protein